MATKYKVATGLLITGIVCFALFYLIGSEVEGVVSRLGDSFKFSAIISIIYGFFCLSLPNTPPKKEAVEKFYEIAMSKGAVDEGAPGVRSDGNYYAYIRDMDGNKIAAKKNLK